MGDKISAEGRAQRGVMFTPRLYHVPATSQTGLSDPKIGFLSFLSDPGPIIVHPIRQTSLFLRGSAGPCARRLLNSSHTNNLVELTSRPFRKLIEWPLLTKIFNRTLTHKLGNMQNMQYYWNCPDIRVTKAPSPIQTRRARPS